MLRENRSIKFMNSHDDKIVWIIFYFNKLKKGIKKCWHFPIFPGRFQPSIFGIIQLNYRVRDGNGCTLDIINTNIYTIPRQFYIVKCFFQIFLKIFLFRILLCGMRDSGRLFCEVTLKSEKKSL